MTGIKPTGSRIHLGNEVGMGLLHLGPDDLIMIADGHAMTDPRAQVSDWSYRITGELMAMGCQASIYRQTDLPQIFHLYWILANLVHRGWMDRMHAMQAANDRGGEVGVGLYTYGILMAADILAVGATHVSVGRDQIQHMELARELAERLHRRCGVKVPVPQAVLSKKEVLPGLDGRKMSKSYGNTLPSICSREELRKLVYKIKTNSLGPQEKKKPEVLYEMYEACASHEMVKELRRRYEEGISWKEVKDMLIELLAERREGREERLASLDRREIEQKWQEGRGRVERGIDELVREVVKRV